ncbi:MAG: hypothetical protein KGI78_01790 [Patescibacteria group bacterium]|nr:hypothetical protein [Patescibacteria group bacterium]MDE1944222.1 hypothetical protein [Patescibacteria group bacterium]MDE1945315.1 hypothetical protein [Patescibacteria group bacterium]MDE2057567.1 hypothetical protein [Patescibacteria group bacterium]
MKYLLWTSKVAVFVGAGCVYLTGRYLLGTSDLGGSLLVASVMLAVAAAILLFANRTGLQRWAKMSSVYLSISAFIVVSTPQQEATFLFTPDLGRVLLVWFLGMPYLLATLVIVAWTRFRSEA